MIVQGPQNVYNSMANMENQNAITRPEVNRNVGPRNTPDIGEKLQTEQQAKTAIQQPLDVSLQRIKNLSEMFNSYRSYVNQIDASNTIIDRITSSVGGTAELLSA